MACKWTGLRVSYYFIIFLPLFFINIINFDNHKQIPVSSEGMQWYEYVNDDIKEQELEGCFSLINKYKNYY